MKDKVTAGVLAIVLGGVGVHKFYLGQVGLGILYIVFCWTFIPWIVGIIEGIIYLTMSDEDFNEKYNLRHVVKEMKGQNTQNNRPDRVADELEKLDNLRSKKAISEDEYKRMKEKLLNQ